MGHLSRSVKKQSFWWAFALACATAAWFGAGLSEGLWVDEIHSSWVIADGWNPIVSRAEAGNQTPLYFWLLAGLTQTLRFLGVSVTDVWLRIPSLLASVISAVICFGVGVGGLARQSSNEGQAPRVREFAWVTIAVMIWFSVDRIQIFYATEARVYGLLQLVQLCGWCTVVAFSLRLRSTPPARSDELPGTDDSSNSLEATASKGLVAADAVTCVEASKTSFPVVQVLVLWGLLSLFGIHLHLMGGLAVAWQALVLSMICIGHRQWRALRWTVVTIFITALGTAPVVFTALTVWQRRHQWAAFANDTSLTGLLSQFPMIEIVIPVLALRVWDYLSDHPPRKPWGHPLGQWIWLTAAAGPLLMAWILTWLEITPIMHRRYLLCAAIPIVLFALGQFLAIRRTSLRAVALSASLLWLVSSQGMIDVWKYGHLVGIQRGEDWRGAVAWINQEFEPGDELWCASGLIEGRGIHYPFPPGLDEYLGFPLRGLYRVERKGEFIEPRAVAGNLQEWKAALSDHQQVAEEMQKVELFLVFRGSRGRLKDILDRLGPVSQNAIGWTPADIVIEPFGRVCVARFRRALVRKEG